MFEAVESIERPNQSDPTENALGEFDEELDAVDAAREARKAFMDKGSKEYAWWVVRKPGAPLAQFISDSKSDKEFVLDLSSGELVEV